MNNLSRRSLIRGAAVLPAAGLGLVSTADASSSPKPKFDEIYDVVIIGSGFSGLAAALAAREAGASAAVFEKMAFVGGNSSLSGGMFAVPGSSVQKEQGIKDSPEALMADMERIGLGLGDPQHIRFVCEHAAETFEWTRSYIGVDWNPTLTGKGGHSAERCLITRQGTGQGIIVPAVKKLASLGVKPRTGCFMEKILRSPEGRVQGVEIREGYVFGKPAAGTVKRIGARRAVVLACGGFGADVRSSPPSWAPSFSPRTSPAPRRKAGAKSPALARASFRPIGFSACRRAHRSKKAWGKPRTLPLFPARSSASGFRALPENASSMNSATAKSARMPFSPSSIKEDTRLH
mgnify:CR=1 FL=1